MKAHRRGSHITLGEEIAPAIPVAVAQYQHLELPSQCPSSGMLLVLRSFPTKEFKPLYPNSAGLPGKGNEAPSAGS